MAGHVFVSYSRTDTDYVRQLVDHLEAEKIKVWYDYQVETGDSFGQRIQDAIDDCVAFIGVLTPASVASPWVRREISYAAEARKTLYPLMLETCRVPIEFAGLHREDVSSGRMPDDPFVRGLRASGHSGKWAEIVRYMHTRYQISDESPTSLKLVFETDDGRSQVVMLWQMTLSNESEEEWLQLESAIGRFSDIDIDRAFAEVQNTVCGGLARVGDLLTFRHSINLTDFEAPQIESPLGLVVNTADRLEQLLTNEDEF